MKEDGKRPIDLKELRALCDGCEMCWETTEEDGDGAEERDDLRMQQDQGFVKKKDEG